MILFVSLILIYTIVCIFGVRLYFYCHSTIKEVRKGVSSILLSYLLFFIFVLIEIPFAIFFPAWLSAKLTIFEHSPNSTMFLLLFGVTVLALSIWKGRAHRPKRAK